MNLKLKKKTSLEISLTPTERLKNQLDEIVADFNNAEDLGDVNITNRDWCELEKLISSTKEIKISTKDRHENIFLSRFGPSISITDLTEWRIMLASRAYQQIINELELHDDKLYKNYSPSKFISALYDATFTTPLSKENTLDKKDSKKQQDILLKAKLSLNRVFIVTDSEEHTVKEIHIPDFTWSPVYVFRSIFLLVIEPKLIDKDEILSVLELIHYLAGNTDDKGKDEFFQKLIDDPSWLEQFLIDNSFPFKAYYSRAKQILDCFDDAERAFIRRDKTSDHIWHVICNIFNGDSNEGIVKMRRRGIVMFRPQQRRLMKSLSLIAMHDKEKIDEYERRLRIMIEQRKYMGQIKSSGQK